MNKTAKSLGLSGAIFLLGLIVFLAILAGTNKYNDTTAKLLILTIIIMVMIGFGISLVLNIIILVMLHKKNKDSYNVLAIFQIVVGTLSILFGVKFISGGLTLASGIIILSTPIKNEENERKNKKELEINNNKELI